jgi:hypothetical protein
VSDEVTIKENRAKRRARLHRARTFGRHTEDEWEAMRFACLERCVRCGREVKLQQDHIVPLYQEERNPGDSIENIQPLCLLQLLENRGQDGLPARRLASRLCHHARRAKEGRRRGCRVLGCDHSEPPH